jgi:mersacidin/lichenicidin family type 2 lantibiotic
MSNTIKAWKNEDYRLSLSDEERAILPENPAGVVELTDEALDDLVAGAEETDSCCWSSCNAPVKQV